MVGTAPAVPLKDVEWRLDSEPKDDRARYVPHINARTAAALMDEWVGPLAWTDEYRTVTIAGKEAILCTVSVFDATGAITEDGKPVGHWVAKQDVGVPSQTEAQKGGISDAFKRVVTVKWGAGRNVYELPTLWAPCRTWTDSKGKVRGYPNNRTLPDLLRQLRELGFDADGGRLEDGAEDLHASNENAETEQDGRGLRGPAPKADVGSRRRSNEPASPEGAQEPVSATSKNRRQALKARCVALTADGVSVADARESAELPLVDSCDEGELTRFENLVATLEASLEAPFAEPSKASV